MKKYSWVFISFLLLVSCSLSPEKLIQYRWNISFVQSPALTNLLEKLKETPGVSDPNLQLFYGNKLILRSENKFDFVLFDNYWHGQWQYDNSSKKLLLTPQNTGTPIVFQVDSVGLHFMQLKLDSSNFKKLPYFRDTKGAEGSWFSEKAPVTIDLEPDKERYNDESKDPYSEKNNAWRIKPVHPESDKEIKKRVLNHLNFFRLLFTDAYDRNKTVVVYNWFVSPVLPAHNGIALKNYYVIKQGWENCFYDSLQAMQGYQLLNDAFSQRFEYPKNDNPFLQRRDMIDSVIANVMKK
jgi:hypothetical protein